MWRKLRKGAKGKTKGAKIWKCFCTLWFLIDEKRNHKRVSLIPLALSVSAEILCALRFSLCAFA
jgi:hypothetical protein